MNHKIFSAGVVISVFGAVFAASARAGAILDNGMIQLGLNEEGHLNTAYGPDSLGIGVMGLRYKPTGAASIETACFCEGWGVSNGLVSGGANISSDGGPFGIQLESFTSNAATATSVVNAGGIFRVTHDYHPSVSANLFEITVAIENITAVSQNLLYRRVVDWDIYPAPTSEVVTIVNSSPIVYRTDTNGFNSADPLSFGSFTGGPSASNGYANLIDLGPADLGALFDFDFGILLAGATQTFTTFYGAGANMAEVMAALTEVSAENVYSLGKANCTACTIPGGAPNTFVLAFKGVGGTLVGGGGDVPEPAALGLLGAGLAGIGAMFRRRRAA